MNTITIKLENKIGYNCILDWVLSKIKTPSYDSVFRYYIFYVHSKINFIYEVFA